MPTAPTAVLAVFQRAAPSAPDAIMDVYAPLEPEAATLIRGQLTYTAIAPGPEGNDITVEHVLAPAATATTVAVTGKHLTVTAGALAVLTASGNSVGDLNFLSTNGPISRWSTLDTLTNPMEIKQTQIVGGSGGWAITVYTDAFGPAQWTSTAQVTSPDQVPAGDWHAITNPDAWNPSGTPATNGGIAVMKNGYFSKHVAAAVNASSAAALVIAVASLEGTGAVAEISATHLSGGAGPTAPLPIQP